MKTIPDFLKIKNVEKTINKITNFIDNEVSVNFQKSGAVIGSSGGIDSAVTIALCARSLRPENVLCLILPEKESDPLSKEHAEKVAKKYNVRTEVIDITSILESFGVYKTKEAVIQQKFPNFNSKCKYRVVVPSKLKSTIGIPYLEVLDDKNNQHKLKISSSDFLLLTAATSIKHRVRMTLLYFHAEKNNFCVVGTTNKSEYQQGYFVKYGDGGSDIEPLVHLYKSQVYQLGEFLNVPSEILTKDATPDVWSFATSDEEFFYSVPYSIVDLLLYAHENKLSIDEIQNLSKLTKENIEILVSSQEQKFKKSQHMREIPHSWIPDFT